MTIKTNTTLEYDKILDMLSKLALSDKVKANIKKLKPYMREADVLKHMKQTTQGKAIIENAGNPPLAIMTNLTKALSLVEQNAGLTAEDLVCIGQFITTCKRMKQYLKKCENVAGDIAAYAGSICNLNVLHDEINISIRGNKVDDRASAQLSSIRRKIIGTNVQIKEKVNQVLLSNKNYLSESFVSYKNGHYTLPVKAQFKSKVKGNIIDMSASRGTYFIEPMSVTNLQGKLQLLEIEEENEVRRILWALTALVEEHLSEIKINIEAMELLDFIFAKAKLSIKMNAIPAKIVTTPKITIEEGRHPFIDENDVVPLNFGMDNKDNRCVVITGPNTGGKTVVLKTVGLFSLMSQCGLHIPAKSATFSMQNMVLCDIGDGQSITENLSTFSSHLTNIIEIIKNADEQSLVILDELGSGTDPAEGMGIAVAVLEELSRKNCLLLATTHYPEIKHFADTHQGFVNARMAFDKENLKPMFKLEIGEAGQSCALYIAKRLGLPQGMINRAYEAAYSQTSNQQAKMIYDEDMLAKPNENQKEKVVVKQHIKLKDDSVQRQKELSNKFALGDSVTVYPSKEIGVVFERANAKGEFGVLIKRQKHFINHKRLKLLVTADELYPDGYDMSIVFDTVANRKARKTMSKRHDPNAVIKIRE